MSGFQRFTDGSSRPPTWAEKEAVARLRKAGAEDVYVEPSRAPDEFWHAVVAGTHRFLLGNYDWPSMWDEWAAEMVMALGVAAPSSPSNSYEFALQKGFWSGTGSITVGVKLAAVELLMDAVGNEDASAAFREFVNGRARWFHVGLRLEGSRFVPTTSEILHVEVVQPTLGLLADPRFADVDVLYRKGFDRALAGDPSGAITSAISAVEETIRVFFPEMADQTLGPLAEYGRAHGLMTEPVEEFTKKLYGLRYDSDAHTAGTDEFALAMLALHIAGSLMLYFAESLAPEPRASS